MLTLDTRKNLEAELAATDEEWQRLCAEHRILVAEALRLSERVIVLNRNMTALNDVLWGAK